MNPDRRNFVKAAALGLPFSAALANFAPAARAATGNKSYIDGVQLGVQTYSFHDILNNSQDHTADIIQKMQACGLYSCELFSAQIEHGVFIGTVPAASDCPAPFKGCPAGKGGSARNPWAWEFLRLTGADRDKARVADRKWRETVPMDYFTSIRKRFNEAGIEIYSYNPMFAPDYSDVEIDRTFQAAKAMGCKAVNISTTLTILKRVIPFAEKNNIIVAPHGHSVTWDPEDFSTRETFVKAFALSKAVGANLDIGHYTACGKDPVAFIDEFHDRITNLHVKDRKRNQSANEEDGANVPWGQGDTPIKAVLQLLKKKKYAIPAFIEYEHAGTDEPVGEVKKAFTLAKKMLAEG